MSPSAFKSSDTRQAEVIGKAAAAAFTGFLEGKMMKDYAELHSKLDIVVEALRYYASDGKTKRASGDVYGYDMGKRAKEALLAAGIEEKAP